MEFLHVKPGKGSAFVRSKLKNLETGNTLEKTWKAGEAFADAQVDKDDMQYSYSDGDDMVFMNMETFGEVCLRSAVTRACCTVHTSFFVDERQACLVLSLPLLGLCAFQERIPRSDIDKAEFIKEEMSLTVLKWRGKAIDVQVPKTVSLKVIEAAPGAKGNTAGGRTEKPVTLETGAQIMVPMFIEEGEEIKVDTEDRKYLGRNTGS